MPAAQMVQGLAAHGQSLNANHTAISPANASARAAVNANGFMQKATGAAALVDDWRWLTGAGTPEMYWIRCTVTSGTLSSGTSGSWIQMSTEPGWSRTRTTDAVGIDQVVATMEIATDNAGARIIASFTMTLTATVDF